MAESKQEQSPAERCPEDGCDCTPAERVARALAEAIPGPWPVETNKGWWLPCRRRTIIVDDTRVYFSPLRLDRNRGVSEVKHHGATDPASIAVLVGMLEASR